MKNIIVISFLFISAHLLSAQDIAYMDMMKASISMMDNALNISELQHSANQFERIGSAMQNKWLPYYYSAYCCIQISHLVKSDEQKDLFVVRAEELNRLADRILPNNSEIYVMKGFILQAKMNVDPMIRGLKYNKECLAMFEKAKKLDPDNPRSYLWHGVNLMNTPVFMGGGKVKARPLIEKALACYNTFQLQSPIHPDWGREYAERMWKECKE
jgi:tetratricopeptide (TPR) repeat protein